MKVSEAMINFLRRFRADGHCAFFIAIVFAYAAEAIPRGHERL
jgi:hypothetical protein